MTTSAPPGRLAEEVGPGVLADVPERGEVARRARRPVLAVDREGEAPGAAGERRQRQRGAAPLRGCAPRAQARTPAASSAGERGPRLAAGASRRPRPPAALARARATARSGAPRRRRGRSRPAPRAARRSGPRASAGGRSRPPGRAAARRRARRPGGGPAGSVPAKARRTACAALAVPHVAAVHEEVEGARRSPRSGRASRRRPRTRTPPRSASTATRWRCASRPSACAARSGERLAGARAEREPPAGAEREARRRVARARGARPPR